MPAFFFGLELDGFCPGTIFLLEHGHVGKKYLGRVYSAANEVCRNQVVVIFAQEFVQGLNLTRCAAEENRPAVPEPGPDVFVNGGGIALQILGTSNLRQPSPLVRDNLGDGMVIIVNGAADKSVFVEHLPGKHGMDPPGGAVQADGFVPGIGRINNRRIVTDYGLRRCFYRAYPFARSAISTKTGVDLGIPEPLVVGLERDGGVGADVSTGIAAATVDLIPYRNHLSTCQN